MANDNHRLFYDIYPRLRDTFPREGISPRGSTSPRCFHSPGQHIVPLEKLRCDDRADCEEHDREGDRDRAYTQNDGDDTSFLSYRQSRRIPNDLFLILIYHSRVNVI